METIKINTVLLRIRAECELFEFSDSYSFFLVYIPVQMTRDNRRNTIDINIKIADRKKNPMLSFVMWNIRVVQLECARNTAAVITGRVLGDSFSPMKPMMARNIPIDVDLLGKSIFNYKLYSTLIP